jgi:oligosaccharyltransferase complex subunit gamma
MIFPSKYRSRLVQININCCVGRGLEPEPLANHISKHTPIPIPYRAPIDWARWVTAATGVLGFTLTLRFIAPILHSRWTWAAGTILTSLIMTSGYMFTRIRGSPYTAGNGQWIAPGFQNQYGQEVHVVALICGWSTLCQSNHYVDP